MAASSSVHEQVGAGLATIGQRYTSGRRDLIDALASAGKPVSLPEMLQLLPDTPQSSAYRNLAVLTQSGAVQRLSSSDEFGRFELAESLTGHHHHHVQCTDCGAVVDVELSADLEKALAKTEAALQRSTGYTITGHQVSFDGLCADCA